MAHDSKRTDTSKPFTFKALPNSSGSSNHVAAAMQRLRAHAHMLQAELWNTKFALEERQNQVSSLKQSLQTSKEEIERLQDLYDECQDSLLDYEEIKEAFDATKKELQEANLRAQRHAAREKLALTKAQNTQSNMLVMSEQNARSILMWVDHLNSTQQELAAMRSQLQQCKDAAAVCAVCHDTKIERALLPCGHCTCSECEEQLTVCPICRRVPTSTAKLYV